MKYIGQQVDVWRHELTDIDFRGEFLGFGSHYDGNVNYSVALIKQSDGFVVEVMPWLVQFHD